MATKITKSELKEMIREALREELSKTKEKIAFMDFTGNSFRFEDLYKKRLAADNFEGTVSTVEDVAMRAVHDAVNSGADVVLYTCDDDYKVNCPELINRPNFKVRLVNQRIKEAANEQYVMQLQAWDKEYYEDPYDDNDRLGKVFGDVYDYSGDLTAIIKKLNSIAKEYEFSFINICIKGTDECVFDAGTTDSTAEEDEFGDLPETDENTVFLNKIIPESTPFMRQFKIASKGRFSN